MSEKAAFTLKGRNPDVLTSIANLSNDEVFTPPELANKMLDSLASAWAETNDGASIWENSSVTFLDPFTKSGVFLREITARLVKGLETQIPDLQTRVNHVLTKQVFGIAITQLTSLLARRSVYCSKWANGEHSIGTDFTDSQGNIWFERTEHTWAGGTTKELRADAAGNTVEVTIDGRCIYCRASRAEYDRGDEVESYAYAFIHGASVPSTWNSRIGDTMKFDVIIGNPPYQLSSGDTSDEPIYQLFVEQAMKTEPRFITMVTPSRWFSGGKNLDDYRKRMIADRRLREIWDFPDSKETFPGVEIKGGVSFFLWNRDHEGDCRFSTIQRGVVVSSIERDLREHKGVIVRDNFAATIIEKVQVKNEPVLASEVSSQTPFGIHTNFSNWKTTKSDGYIRLYKRGLEEAWVDPSYVTAHSEWIPNIKVLISKAYNGGDAVPHQVIGRPVITEANSVCTQTYIVARNCESQTEAENFAEYLKTRFVRFLVRQRKISQDNRPDTFAFVPSLDMSKRWTDEELYNRYNISADEQAYIASQVKLISSVPAEGDDDE